MRVIRCEWCGNTYSEQREWCPHCLAPRLIACRSEEEDSGISTEVFFADGVPYMVIESAPNMVIERVPLTPNEARELLPFGTVDRR